MVFKSMSSGFRQSVYVYLLGTASWACGLCSLGGPHAPRAPHLTECFAETVLKFLTVMSLNLCFVSEGWQDVRACTWVEKMSSYGCPLCLSPHSFKEFTMPREHRVLVSPRYVEVQWDSKYIQGKHFMSMIDFPLERELALNIERRQKHTEKHEWQGTPPNPFLYYLSVLASTYAVNNDTEERELL